MTYHELLHRLTPLYDHGEAKSIVKMVLEECFGMSAADIYCGKVSELSPKDTTSLLQIMARLEMAEPVQYVLGTAVFASKAFSVAPGVLIPRPETEDLCEWILSDEKPDAAILDVGCGSGCIAITLRLNMVNAKVTAWDVSGDAIKIARANARSLRADVNILRQDALSPPNDSERWDIIVSNPPYVCLNERAGMSRNVLDHEPATALFVPDDDPLLFYMAISRYAVKALRQGGCLYFETNHLYVNCVVDLLRSLPFGNIETREDRYGKARFVKATR